MATTTITAPREHSIHPIRYVIATILGIVLLAVAVTIYRHDHTTQSSSQSTEQSSPQGSVNQGANPTEDATPRPNGTNGLYE